MLFDLLAQLALGAIARHPNRATHRIMRELASTAAGLLVAMMLTLLAVVCLVAGALIAWAPPLDAPHLLFILAAGMVVAAVLVWLVLCKGKGPGQLVSEALNAPTATLDDIPDAIGHTIGRFSDAFNRGWNHGHYH